MAVTFVSSPSTGTAGTGDITPTMPTGVDANDILILPVETAATESVSTPSGWNLLDQAYETGDASTGTRLTVFWKRAVGGDTAPTITDPGDHAVGRIVAYRDCKRTGDPFDAVTGGVDSSAGTSVSITGVTTTAANCLVLNILAMPTDTNTSNRITDWTNANLTSITERIDAFTTSNNGGGIGLAEGYKASAGSTGATTATLAVSEIAAFMTVSLVPHTTASTITQVGSATTDSVNNGDSITITKPTGVASGDVMIACVTQNENALTATGWTLIRELTAGETTNSWSSHVYYKIAGGSEPSNYTFSHGGGTTAPLVGIISAWRGVNNSNPINVSSETATTDATEPALGTTVTTTATTRRITVRGVRCSSVTAATFSGGPGYTELADVSGTSSGTVRYSICQYARDFEDPAASGYNTAALTSSQTETDSGIFNIALEAAAVAETADAEAVTAASTANAAGAKLGALSGSVAPSVTANASTARTGIGAASPSNTAAATVDKPTPGVKTRAESIG